LVKINSDKKLKKIKIQIKNADVSVAGEITHYLYKMVDNQELHSVSIDEVRKSEKSIEVVIIVVVWIATNVASYLLGKGLDIPYNRAVRKIRSMLLKRKRQRHGTLDAFMDDDPIE